MAYITTLRGYADAPASEAFATSRGGFFARMLAAIMKSRQQQAEREIAAYLAVAGKFNDETEREIQRRVLA
jgi:hypothetical protein